MVKYELEFDWNKLIAMSLILVSVFIWIGFQNYISQQSNIYIGQYVPPLLVIGSMNLIGVLFSLRIKNGLMKYVLLLIQLVAIYYAFAAAYSISEIGGGIFKVLEQVSY